MATGIANTTGSRMDELEKRVMERAASLGYVMAIIDGVDLAGGEYRYYTIDNPQYHLSVDYLWEVTKHLDNPSTDDDDLDYIEITAINGVVIGSLIAYNS